MEFSKWPYICEKFDQIINTILKGFPIDPVKYLFALISTLKHFWQITNLSNFPVVRTSNRVFSNHNVFIYTGRWLPSGCGVKILQLDRWVFDSCHRQKSWLSFFRNSFSNTANFSELFGPDKTSMRLKCKKSTKLKVFYFSKEKYTTECNNP